MVKIITSLALLALLSLHPSPSPAAQLIDQVAATVNEEPVTALEVEKEYLQMQKEQERIAPAERIEPSRKGALDRLVDKRLIEQKIRELDIKVSDEEVKLSIEDVKKQNHIDQETLEKALAGQGISYEQYRSQFKEQLERLRLMSQEVRSKIQVGDREVREYYEANRAKYGTEEEFRARHIFFKVDQKGGAEELARIEAQANEVLKEARSGKDFAELARKYSTDPAAARDGGDLGSFKKGEMIPEIGDTVAALKPGEVSSLVRSPSGIHIIKLEGRSQGSGKPLEQVKGEIEDLLYKKKSDERFAQWLKELRDSAAIDIREL